MKDLNSEQNWIYDLIESSDEVDIEEINSEQLSSTISEKKHRELRSVITGVCNCRACRVYRRERQNLTLLTQQAKCADKDLSLEIGLNCILISPTSQDRLIIKQLLELNNFALIPRLSYNDMLAVIKEIDVDLLAMPHCAVSSSGTQIYVTEGSWTSKLSEASITAISSINAFLSCAAALARHSDTIWIFDMPDIAVHRSHLKDFSKKLSQIAMKYSSRLVVITQNPELLAHAENQYVINLTKITPLNRKIIP